MSGSIFDKVTLNNGYQMPRYGIGPNKPPASGKSDGNVKGTAMVVDPGDHIKDFQDVLQAAVDAGFRSFDSGARYGTEEDLGIFFKNTDIPRDELFITTKVNNKCQGYDATMRDFENSLSKLQVDYVDMYLIHCPVPVKGLYVETWKAFEKIYESGRAKAIGVSNFTVQHLYDIFDNSDIVPVVNQKEQHPFYVQPNLLAFEKRHGIISQSYSPLGGGRFARDPRVQWLADKYGKSIAQIILRWHVQMGFMVVTRSAAKARIDDNANIFDFELTPEEMGYMFSLNHGDRRWHDPDRFPGTYAHVRVEQAFRDAAAKEIDALDVDDAKKEKINADLELVLEPQDVDFTRDYIIYCFQKAVARYGANGQIEDQACEMAAEVAKEVVARLAAE